MYCIVKGHINGYFKIRETERCNVYMVATFH